MFERGVPKAKPLTQAQLEEQAATRQMLAERKEKQLAEQLAAEEAQ